MTNQQVLTSLAGICWVFIFAYVFNLYATGGRCLACGGRGRHRNGCPADK